MLSWHSCRQIFRDRIFYYFGLLFLLRLIILITYSATQRPDTAFEKSMNGQDFGVRVLFTAFGVLVSLFSGLYTLVSPPTLSRVNSHISGDYTSGTFLIAAPTGAVTLEPCRRLWRAPQPQPAIPSLAIAPPNSVFAGLLSSLLRREAPFVSLVALSTLLSQFIPIFLASIPFSPIQTWQLHLVCRWATVSS